MALSGNRKNAFLFNPEATDWLANAADGSAAMSVFLVIVSDSWTQPDLASLFQSGGIGFQRAHACSIFQQTDV